MKIILIGASGMLGREIVESGSKRGFEFICPTRPDFDLANPASVNLPTGSEESLVINAAAYTNVLQAEKEPDKARVLNHEGPALLAAACRAGDLPLIQISTDYVFDGKKKGAYQENDLIAPLGVYGRSKAAGEEAVSNSWSKHLIVRTSWLYGLHGRNFVKTMLRLGLENEEIQVVTDQQGCPTWTADLAEALLALASLYKQKKELAWGVYHFTGRGYTTWHGFARKIFDLARVYCVLKVKRITPATTDQFPGQPPRPANSVLNCDLIRKTFGLEAPPWEKSLARMMDRAMGPRLLTGCADPCRKFLADYPPDKG